MADETYSIGQGWTKEQRRDWARLELRDSNTVGKDYLLLKVSYNAVKHPKWGIQGDFRGGSIRMHKGQVKRLIKALNKFVKESEAEQ